ncbi:zinc ABC transporter permease [Bifidobacterium dolichotidis]|uniref:Zinc ABC transporter permease n=1 Tax=Bifidobacterium dolichotidis TaxID=2306976 RepID=A0A430FSA5_9BIFI|nr:DUF3159 domain-containing protein [Bifidobacterium dolichotidis]RSX55745.1 zinc ABC transporter permease [Bifidobacterium dolichotidis]
MSDQVTKPRTGLSSLASAGEDDDFSILTAIGGPRGIIESMLPGVLFVVMFLVTSNLGMPNSLELTILASAVLAVLQLVIRLIQRQSIMGAVSGLAAIAICLVWAWQSHEARNYYTFGFLTNAFYIVLLSISLIVRVPGLGFVVEFVRTLPTEHFGQWLASWRNDKPLYRAYRTITWLWIALFTLRLVVQVPLYMLNYVGWLGMTRLIMGIPFWALSIWISYLIVATPLHHHRMVEKAAKAQAEQQSSAE